jgi:hypothetical protein
MRRDTHTLAQSRARRQAATHAHTHAKTVMRHSCSRPETGAARSMRHTHEAVAAVVAVPGAVADC